MTKKKDINEQCDCCEECTCGSDCHCDSEHKCSDNCHCGETSAGCECGKECKCNEGKDCGCGCDEKRDEYLNLARQIQADFENYRRHVSEDIRSARISGQVSVIEAFLPCLDTFKDAKKMITDEKVLSGVEMIENKILDTLKVQGVEKIASIGEKYNPDLHNVIAVMKDENKENDIILDEYQAGYKLGGKVIRYAKVIVNKKED